MTLNIYANGLLGDLLMDYLKKGFGCTFQILSEEDLKSANKTLPILFVMEDLSYAEIVEWNERLRKNKYAALFVYYFNNQLILGPTYIPQRSAGIDSSLYYQYLQLDRIRFQQQAWEKIRLPTLSNDKVEAVNALLPELSSKLITEVKRFVDESAADDYLEYINNVEIFSLKSRSKKEKYIFPLFEDIYLDDNSPLNGVKDTRLDWKITYRDYINTALITNKSRFYTDQRSFSQKKDESLYHRIGIVGGGTAGYLTAIAMKEKYPSLEVNLIESSRIPVIGVGEATTPTLLQFLFNELKLDKEAFYREVEPTWKLGIKFDWGLPGDYYFNYPFGKNEILPAYLHGNINMGSLNSILMNREHSFVMAIDPKKQAYQSLSKKCTYAYHLDNKKFVQYLKKVALQIGVQHADEEISKVVSHTDQSGISHLETKKGSTLTYDFYVDCTGFRSMLLEKSLNVSYVSYKKSLFTDTALVGKIPHHQHIKPYTSAITMQNGWCWNIPVRESDHVGYVYASDFCEEATAAEELQRKYPQLESYKRIQFRSGRHAKFLIGNLAAIGNSFAFVEPLESTGIHMIIKEIQILSRNFSQLKVDKNEQLRSILNKDMNDRWDYLRWFLAIHYKFNKKLDTPFWQHCHSQTDISGLQDVINIYQNHGLLSETNDSLKRSLERKINDHLFGLDGLDTLLLGQGVVPGNLNHTKPVNENLWNYKVATWKKLSEFTIPVDKDMELMLHDPSLM